MSRVLSVTAGHPPTGRTVLIVGSGAGGVAAAIDLAIEGWDVLLTDPHPEYIPDPGSVRYLGVAGSGSVDLIATELDVAGAVEWASLVVVATLATAAADVIELLSSSVRDDQAIIAACGGLVSLAIESALGSEADMLIGELSCFPYSSRFRTDGAVNIRRRRPVRLAATASRRTPELGEVMPATWVGLPAASALHAAVLNPNYVVHPASVVINLASRDRNEDVPHEGITDGARRVAAEIDRDKCALLAGLGLPELSFSGLMEEMERDGSKARSVEPDPPEPILDRYLTEDCGMGLSLLAELGKAAGIELPTIAAIRTVLAVSLPQQLPGFPFDLLDTTPSGLLEGRAR
jgi:hypothetical protein